MLDITKDIDKFRENTSSSKLIFDGKVIDVYVDGITLPDGKMAEREYIRHIGAVCVIPITQEREVICVRQYRYAAGEMLLEIPAGKLDFKGEDTAEAAMRELREETGARCSTLTYLGKYLGSPAILDECIHMYMAQDLTFGDTDPDEDEFLDTVRIPLNELVDLIMDGKIPDGKTQAAVLRAARMLEKE